MELLSLKIYVAAHEPGLGARRAKLSLQCVSKIKSLPKHLKHDAMFDNKYKKSDTRPNAILVLALTASNIDLSDILETPSCFMLTPCCIKPPKIVLHLEKDRTDASVYKQLYRWFKGWEFCGL